MKIDEVIEEESYIWHKMEATFLDGGSFLNTKLTKARKNYNCNECGCEIKNKDYYYKVSGYIQNEDMREYYNERYCVKCTEKANKEVEKQIFTPSCFKYIELLGDDENE